jgi:hypothetical protein
MKKDKVPMSTFKDFDFEPESTQSSHLRMGPPPLHPSPYGPTPSPIGHDDFCQLLIDYGDDEIKDNALPSFRSVLCDSYEACEGRMEKAFPGLFGWSCYGCPNVPKSLNLRKPSGPTADDYEEMHERMLKEELDK